MPKIDFPDTPSLNDTYTYLTTTWKWNGTAWEKSAATETGNTEGNTGEIAYYDTFGSVIKGATAFKYDDSTGVVHFYQGISADKGATFANDITVNDMTIGKGLGQVVDNTAVGYQALNNNTDGDDNTAIGFKALNQNTTGEDNTAIGNLALRQNTEGDANTAIGNEALYTTQDGVNNTATGYRSLYYNQSGDNNTAFGNLALYRNQTGENNTGLGQQAGGDNMTGNNNTCIGFDSQTTSISASNEIVLGNSDVTLIHSVAGMSMGGGATFAGPVIISNVADAVLTLNADTNNAGENDNPHINFKQDGGANSFSMGMNGSAGELFTNAIADRPYISSYWGMQLATGNTARVDVDSTGLVHLYQGLSAGAGATFAGNVNVLGGLTADTLQVVGGATFGGDVHFSGDIILPEDGEIQIGGDSEKIIFNGGSAIINIIAGQVSVGSGGGNGYIKSYGDNDTFMRYQANQWSLDVGGTTYMDVTSAGTNFADTDVVRPKLKDYGETVNVIGTITGDTTVDIEAGNIQTVTVSDSATEFDFENWSPDGTASTLTLIITNGGSQTVTWVSAVKWPGDNAPALTSSGIDIISFMTIDAGNNIYGFVGGIHFQ